MPEEIQQRLIEEEMKESYIDYAMSVIVGRALPDVRDGLKPVHRRILYAMNEMGLLHNKPFKKSARIVGEVLGKFHPHGDSAVYDSLVRMAQDFSLRYPLIKGQGNFGSIDGDRQAAMRYTEAKLKKIAEELLIDIEKDTVDFVDNFDGSLKEPLCLPAKLPNLLINGSSGIAVGMATNVPPHNINEIIEGIIAYVDDNEISINDLIGIVKGPDFPTAGIICGRNGIINAYNTGRGKIIVRGNSEIKDNNITITEIPYMVNKSQLIENIADLVRDKRIEGISDIRDESDRKGMSIVIKLRKGSNADVILNQLYKHTQLQATFGVIMLALHNGQPKIMGLKEIISHYVEHRKNIVERRTRYDLGKAENRVHILEGLQIALNNIDNVIKTIKASKDGSIAREELRNKFELTDEQAQAILDMRLQRLTSLEQGKIKNEYEDLIKLIGELKNILESPQRVLDIIKNELLMLKEKYGDERKTRILDVEEEIETLDLIEEEDVVITLSYKGYVKQMPLATYRSQRRGGAGIKGAETKEEDVIEHLFITSNHNTLLIFTNKGKVHWLKAYQIPEAGRYSKGKAIINLLRLGKDEIVNAILPVGSFDDDHYLLFATKNGLLKKTNLGAYSNPRKGGIIGINLREGDELVQVRLVPGEKIIEKGLDMILASKQGYAIRFNEKQIRNMGRTASGVRGMLLRKGDCVVGMEVALQNASLLTVTENGYGKRTSMEEYRTISRGGKGVINIQTSERNGKVIGIKTVKEDDEIMLISKKGIVIRMPAKISLVGRNTKGVKLMKLKREDKVTTVARVVGSFED